MNVAPISLSRTSVIGFETNIGNMCYKTRNNKSTIGNMLYYLARIE